MSKIVKRNMMLVLILGLMLSTGCGADQKEMNEVSGILGTENENEKNDDVEAEKNADLEAEKNAALEAEKNAALEAEKEAAQNKEDTNENAEIDAKKEIAVYLEELPALPSEEYECSYVWSERWNRVTHYILTLNEQVPMETVFQYCSLLESEYGYTSTGKDEWSEKYNCNVSGYATADGKRIDVMYTDSGVTMSIRIYC